VGAPGADALDRHELGDHLLVGQRVEPLELERAVVHVLGQRAQVHPLGARETDRAQLVGVVVEDLLRCRLAAAEAVGQAPVDRGGGLGRELLADDRPHQRAVVVALAGLAALAQAVGAVAVDQGAEDRVCSPKVRQRSRVGAHAEARSAVPSSAPSARSTDIVTQVKVGVSRSV
jgi:hypothetical protein